MSAKSVTKGKAGEREFSKLLSELLDAKLQRNLGQARDGGHDLDDKSNVLNAWAIEVKRSARSYSAKWWDQAVEQAERTALKPMLAYRIDNQKWVLMVRAADLPYFGNKNATLDMLKVIVSITPQAFAQALKKEQK